MLTSRTTLIAPALPRAAGLLIGYGLDRLLGDPRRGHPVAAFGRLAGALESRLHRDQRTRGAAYVAVLVGATAGSGVLVERATRNHPLVATVATAAATWAVLGGRSLEWEASTVAAQLLGDDLPAARDQITHLVGRDPSGLDAAELARACVESVAENTSDAVVAPLFWGAVAGVPGLLGYRAANTLDAMVGHRSARYRRFGWAAARLDDVLNWIPARLAGLLVAGLGADPKAAAIAVRRDAGAHPSPNAGVVEAAFAGALGLRLGGVNRYGDVVEDRARLGSGRPPEPADIARTTELASRVGVAAAVLAAAAALATAAALGWSASTVGGTRRGS
ncbi:cobalamin biosynthesis protein [Microlunatus ginsengisoli]|uniref:Cobalamin biosynthesis protein CobD n=1 Tax=Microlunatus ginsengisoli TaxID=363863 RepID=A0ABP7A1Q0_9ACTN